MMKRLLLPFILSFFLVAPVVFATEGSDLSISANSISFSAPLIAGDRVRLYASVKNEGTKDTSGYVSFFQGSIPIDDSRVVSLRAGGLPDEVYIDFVVPSQPFNLRAEIRGTDPQDINSANDAILTGLYTPILDDDRDGVENAADSCPNTANKDQLDTDHDGVGDACDTDDDDDGWSDYDEAQHGTDQVLKDTDGDGINDPQDFYPLDSSRSVFEPPKPKPKPEPAPVPKPKPVPVQEPETVVESSSGEAAVDSLSETAAKATTNSNEPQSSGSQSSVSEGPSTEQPSISNIETFSPKAIFSFRRSTWNTYEFSAAAPAIPGYKFAWDFGDGVTSRRHTISHVYRRSGAFDVTFRMTDLDGKTAEDTTRIYVPMFTLENPTIVLLLVALVIGAIVIIILLARLSGRGRKRASRSEDE